MRAYEFYPLGAVDRDSNYWMLPVLWLHCVTEYFLLRKRETMRVWIKDRKTGQFLDPRRYRMYVEGVDFACKSVVIEDIPTKPPTKP